MVKKENDSLFQMKYLKLHLLVGLGLLTYMIILQVTEIYSPIWYLTGLSMPTTGVTRAWIQMLQGNVGAAFEYNAVFLAAPFLAITAYRYLIFNKKKDLNLALGFALIFAINQVIRGF